MDQSLSTKIDRLPISHSAYAQACSTSIIGSVLSLVMNSLKGHVFGHQHSLTGVFSTVCFILRYPDVRHSGKNARSFGRHWGPWGPNLAEDEGDMVDRYMARSRQKPQFSGPCVFAREAVNRTPRSLALALGAVPSWGEHPVCQHFGWPETGPSLR